MSLIDPRRWQRATAAIFESLLNAQQVYKLYYTQYTARYLH